MIQLKFKQIEAAIIDLFTGKSDQPTCKVVCKSLEVSSARLTKYLEAESDEHGYYYRHWRQFRDCVLERHWLGYFVPLDAPYDGFSVFIPIPLILGESWAARW